MNSAVQKHIQVDSETGAVSAPAMDFAAMAEEFVAST